MKSITAILLLTAAFSSLVSAWGIAFYTGKDCAYGDNVELVMYDGQDVDGFSACVRAGDANAGMECHKQDVAGAISECDGPMDLKALGVMYTEHSDCCVGFSSDCYDNTCDYAGDQCLWTEGMPGASSDTVTFKCKYNSNPVAAGKKIFNGTHIVTSE